MADVIQLLPDAVANQIAAGEVVQRPASVVKELVENSIDAGSSSIKVIIKDAGRTLIQIIDNGCGMSETDARLSFERHATSKIRCADDLFALSTMGFRGEALASIAAIASVELRTRRSVDELGVCIVISGSVVERQESISCAEGTNFSIKNLFFNVPARRKFLKSDNVEFSHVIDEMHRVALANPQIAFTLIHNDKDVIVVPASSLRQRIINLFGKQMDKVLLPVEASTNLVNITGYVGNPSYAKKRSNEQFFFVNNRFFRQKSFAWALLQAYKDLIAQGNYPAYFIYFDINPADIDVNIHPTKTEIKFTHEYETSQLLEASVKQVLGKYNIVPSIDFSDETNYSDLFAPPSSGQVRMPTVEVRSGYTPFQSSPTPPHERREKDNLTHWQSLYSQLHKSAQPEPVQQQLPMPEMEAVPQTINIIQLKNRWIATGLKSGLVVIDQHRAHERILYERFLNCLHSGKRPSQSILMPQHFDVSPADFVLLRDVLEDVRCMGFDIEEFGANSFVVNGIPADCKASEIESLLGSLLENYREHQQKASSAVRENLAQSMAQTMAIGYGQPLSMLEMQRIVSDLFQCSSPNTTADGRKILFTVTPDDIVSKLM